MKESKQNQQKFISAKSLAKRWDMDISTVYKILAPEKIKMRMGEKKGNCVRYPIEEIERLEIEWQRSSM